MSRGITRDHFQRFPGYDQPALSGRLVFVKENDARQGAKRDFRLVLLVMLWVCTAALSCWINRDSGQPIITVSTRTHDHPTRNRVTPAQDPLQALAQELQTTHKRLAGMLPER